MNLVDDGQLDVDLAPEHQLLGTLIGQWKGTTRLWLNPEDPPQISETLAVFRPLLGGLFVREEYEGFSFGEKHKGYRTYGFEVGRKTAVCSWVDSIHMSTGMMHLEGTIGGPRIALSGRYYAGENNDQYGWRTVLEIDGKDRLKISQYNVMPDGESLGMETLLQRS